MQRAIPCIVLIAAGLGCAGEPDGRQRDAPAAAASPSADELLAFWRVNGRDPRTYVVEKFRSHDWVFLGEYHRVKHDADLVLALIPVLHRDTDVRCLATEFLWRERTDAANALVTAEEYDRARTIDFFRTQFPGWSYEEYVDVFRVIWESNRQLAASRGPFRLLGLHPGIDWERIHYGSAEDAQHERDKQQRYDAIMAEALDEGVLQTGAKALVYTGIAHATAKYTEYRIGTEEPLPRMGNLVRSAPYAARMFFICLHAPFYDAGVRAEIYPFDGALDRLMTRYRGDIGFDVVGTPFAGLTHARQTPFAITSYSFGELYDGYVMHATPIKQYRGATCVPDWITTEEQFRHFCRHLPNKDAGESFALQSLAEFQRDHCAPRASHGVEFKQRFRRLPDLD